MKVKIDPGFFTMDDVNFIVSLKSLMEAKNYSMNKINDFLEKHPNTKPENIGKAIVMINSAGSIRALALDISNFILAHSSENLKVIK